MDEHIIDDEVRKSFPGMSDEDIYKFYVAAKGVEDERPTIYDSDLSHARIIDSLGWDAFKEYLRISVGFDELDSEDYIALTNAVSYLKDIYNAQLYGAIYGAAAEASSKKTVSARKTSYNNLLKPLDQYRIDRGL
jgi:hypothetical protein